MQFKLAALSTLAVATLAAATPLKRSQCNTGEMHCCNTVQAAGSKEASTLLGLLNVVVDDVKVLVGMNCSPLTAIGLGGNSCTAQPVCCTNNNFSGVIVIGCSPININL